MLSDCIYYVRWDISPEAFSVIGLHMRYYSLFLIVAFISAAFVFYTILKRENKSLFLLPVTFNTLFLASLVGARLGECIFYFPDYYMRNPLEIFIPYHNGEYVGIGGLSSHGAALVIIPALILTARNNKISTYWLIDRVCVVVPLAAFFIRIGNLMNSEIVGTETDIFWGFIFERRNEDFPRHPVQLYEALCYLCIFIFIYRFYKIKQDKITGGIILGLFLVLTFFLRFILEMFKAPLNDFDRNSIFSIGQYLNLFFSFTGAALLYLRSSRFNN